MKKLIGAKENYLHHYTKTFYVSLYILAMSPINILNENVIAVKEFNQENKQVWNYDKFLILLFLAID